MTIKESFFKDLGISESHIDIHRSFKDYGIDSITGVNVISTINRKLGIDLKKIALFDYTSISDLTDYIYTEYKDEIQLEKSESVEEDDLKAILRELEQGKRSVEDVNEFLGGYHG